MKLDRGYTYHISGEKDGAILCGSGGRCISVQELKTLTTAQRDAVCIHCYMGAVKIFKDNEPYEYIKYCHSLPCGDWTQAQIEGLWNAALDAAVSRVNEDGCVYADNYLVESIKELKI